MKDTLKFLMEIGELKNIQRRGVLYYGFKKADSATDHVFRLMVMVWIFGQSKKINIGKAFKIALVHDFCKVYTGDLTPYEGLFPKNKKKNQYKLAWKWRRLSLREKQRRYAQKFRKERNALKKLVGKLPLYLKKEIMDLRIDYHEMKSPEAKFVLQLDMAENLLEALESFEKDKKFPTKPWWEHADEVIHDKNLLKLLEEIEKKELQFKKSL